MRLPQLPKTQIYQYSIDGLYCKYIKIAPNFIICAAVKRIPGFSLYDEWLLCIDNELLKYED